MPTLQQLRYLVSLAETRHFRRAAEACHVTQPTLSAQLKDLEIKLGTPLVERARGGVIVTPVGEQVYHLARGILRDIEEIRAVTAARRARLARTIRVGVVQSSGSYLLPFVVPDLHARHPGLGLYIREGMPQALLHMLGDGALDLLVFPLPVGRQDLDSLSMLREPLLAVLPRDHPLAAEDTLAPARLRGETILSLEPGHRLYDQVRDLCEENGAHLSRDYEGTSLDTLRQMVAMGMGLSVMPALYVRSEVRPRDAVVARPFRSPAPGRTIGMVWRRGTTFEAEYRELARDICGILSDAAPEVTVLGA